MQEVVLFLQSDYALPDVYLSKNVNDIQNALNIGAYIYQMSQSYVANKSICDLEEEKNREIHAILERCHRNEKKLNDELERVRGELERAEVLHSQAVKDAKKAGGIEMENAWSEKVSELQGKLGALESRRKILEEGRDQDIQSAIQRERHTMERLISEKEKEVGRLQNVLESLQDTIQKQTSEIEKLGGAISKKVGGSTNVKIKGSEYEEEFRQKLVRYYGILPGFSLKDTARGGGHEGDYIMDCEGKTMMWELKNYSDKVPSSEVKKFHRDLKGCEGARIGVMISRGTDIMGIHGPFVVEEWEGRLVVYINRFEEFSGEDEGRIFQILIGLFRMWWKSGSGLQNDSEDSKIEREEILREVEKGISELAKRRTEWRTHKGRVEEMMRWVTDMIEESQGRIDRILRKVQGKMEEVDICIDTRKRGKMNSISIFKIDNDEKGIIPAILKKCVEDDSGEIGVKELAELIAEDFKVSRDTLCGYIQKVIGEDYIIKKKNSKYIRGLSYRGGF